MNDVAKEILVALLLDDGQGANQLIERALASSDGDVSWLFKPVQGAHNLFDYVLAGNRPEALARLLPHLQLADIPPPHLNWQAALPDQDALRCFDDWLGNQDWPPDRAKSFFMHLFQVADAERFIRLLEPLSKHVAEDFRSLVFWAFNRMKEEVSDDNADSSQFFHGIDYGRKFEALLPRYEPHPDDILFHALHRLVLTEANPELSWTNLDIARSIEQLAERMEQMPQRVCQYLDQCLRHIFVYSSLDKSLEVETRNQVAIAFQRLMPHQKTQQIPPDYSFFLGMLESFSLTGDGAKALAELVSWCAQVVSEPALISRLQPDIYQMAYRAMVFPDNLSGQSAYDMLQALSEHSFAFEPDFLESVMTRLEGDKKPDDGLDQSFQKVKSLLERWILRQGMGSGETATPEDLPDAASKSSKPGLDRAAALGL